MHWLLLFYSSASHSLLLLIHALQENKAVSLGALVVRDLSEFNMLTHFIGKSDDKTPLRRTPKLLGAMSVTSHIMNSDWVDSSFEEGHFVSCDDFLLVDDEVSEKNMVTP